MAAYEVGGQIYLMMANEGDMREDDGDKARVKDSGLAGSPGDLSQRTFPRSIRPPERISTLRRPSISIRDADGNLIFDSGNRLDAEPEGVELMEIGGRMFAFIGLERTGPANASFVEMIVTDSDLAPEGMKAFFTDGKYYLAIVNEVSNTTSVYSINIAAVSVCAFAVRGRRVWPERLIPAFTRCHRLSG